MNNVIFTASALDNLTTAGVGERFGRKAAGFVALPAAWRPQALFLTSTVYKHWLTTRSFGVDDRETLLKGLANAAETTGENVILRSSATDETVQERGRFRSDRADLRDLSASLNVIEGIFQAYSSKGSGQMCLMVQEYVPAHVTGFLSNELRLVDKPYRWVVEQEVRIASGLSLRSGSISAKQAREYPTEDPLICLSPGELRSRLSSVAGYLWRTSQKRLLIEWCWDGQRLWLLQCDDATAPSGGRLPRELKQKPDALPDFRDGATFKVFQVGSTTPWKKLKNVVDFSVGGKIPPHRLYYAVASDVQSAIDRDETALSAEIDRMTAGRAVIRSDAVTSRFNLPRSDTLTGDQAVEWLKVRLAAWLREGRPSSDLAFIMHSYIPARAAAWSYYRRGERTVFIDGLWGLADGMQYYPCDTYIADVRGSELSVTARFKELVLLEQDDGSWKTDNMDQRFARHRALSRAEVSDIAIRSAEIANNLGKDVQIMWFVDVPEEMSLGSNLPWYKVTPEQSLDERRSTPLDARRIRTPADLRDLEEVPAGSVKLILEPVGEDLRSDEFINAVAATSSRLHLPVELRGSILGHAYHQLKKAGVEVYSAEPRKRFQEVRQRKVFQKLVRDDIPEVIRRGGESVTSNELVAEDIKIALIGKLIEESEELLNASSHDAISEELGDILEVLRGLAHALNVDPNAFVEAANQKREKRGGFERGTVLRGTEYKLVDSVAPSLFHYGTGEKPKIALSDLSEKITGSAILNVPVSKLLGSPRGRRFKLETRDLGDVLVTISLTGGAVSVFVEGEKTRDKQADLF